MKTKTQQFKVKLQELGIFTISQIDSFTPHLMKSFEVKKPDNIIKPLMKNFKAEVPDDLVLHLLNMEKEYPRAFKLLVEFESSELEIVSVLIDFFDYMGIEPSEEPTNFEPEFQRLESGIS